MTADESIDSLLGQASAAQRAGNATGARAAFERAIALDPAHAGARNAFANLLLRTGDARGARIQFEAATRLDPGAPALHLNLAAACSASGDLPAALAALDAALALDPELIQARFQKGVVLEQMGAVPQAAQVFRDVLDAAPPEVRDSAQFRPALDHARTVIDADNDALGIRIGQALGDRTPSRLVTESIDRLLGRQPAYLPEPTFLNVARLPPVPFFDRSLTPWIERFEAGFETVKRELLDLIAANPDGPPDALVPYVANPPGTPLNQWKDLDHSLDWGAFFFWKHGERFEENCKRCPGTAALLDSLPLLHIAGRGPNAFFSFLKPRLAIPPHTGVTNLRATVHLPLIVPEGCGFRVGPETREWREGVAWAFDDTINHEAWNHSDQLRVILIVDVWNPYLTLEEQQALAAALDAYSAHYNGMAGWNGGL